MRDTIDIAEAAEIFKSDAILVERRLAAGVLSHEVVDGEVRIPLTEAIRLQDEEAVQDD